MSKRIIAAFDFDGTLTKRDTLLPFIRHAVGGRILWRKLLPLAPKMVAFLRRKQSRQQTKESILTHFFRGLPAEQFHSLGQTFAHSPALAKLLLPQAMKRLQWHKKQKHECILISAAIDTYLEPWHKKAGFTHLICSHPEINPHKVITGRLAGLNCWGPEKVRRLLEYAGPKEDFILYAYGDSRGDHELLQLADFPFYKAF